VQQLLHNDVIRPNGNQQPQMVIDRELAPQCVANRLLCCDSAVVDSLAPAVYQERGLRAVELRERHVQETTCDPIVAEKLEDVVRTAKDVCDARADEMIVARGSDDWRHDTRFLLAGVR
jgi:hypothetical protein